jgi:hypothetical protein
MSAYGKLSRSRICFYTARVTVVNAIFQRPNDARAQLRVSKGVDGSTASPKEAVVLV